MTITGSRDMAPALAVLLSGAMWFASSGVDHCWPLAWLAPLLLLVVLPDMRASRAALAAFVGPAAGALNLVIAYYRLPPMIVPCGDTSETRYSADTDEARAVLAAVALEAAASGAAR